jgi:hypothetical protein
VPQISLTVELVGNYSYLALENLMLSGAGTLAGVAGLPPPPFNQAILGNPSTGTRTVQAQTSAKQTNLLFSPPWVGWIQTIRNLVNFLLSQKSTGITVEAPSVDETDVDWHAWLTGGMNAQNPVTFTPTFTPFKSRYGRVFAVNDLALIADPASYIDGSGVSRYAYEIVQITAISAAGAWTLSRGLYGTPCIQHALSPLAVYRMVDVFWLVPLPAPGSPQLVKLPWDNMCVAVLSASIAGATTVLLNLIPLASTGQAVPGFRTLSGAEYTLGATGAISAGMSSALRLTVAGWHSIRNAFFEFDAGAGAGTGGAGDTLITLVYIAPGRIAAYQVATFTIPGGSTVSFLTPPQNRRTPYTGLWPFHANLPLMVGALNATGVLQTGFTLDPTHTASISEDGELDFIVTQAATTPGNGLRGTVQI